MDDDDTQAPDIPIPASDKAFRKLIAKSDMDTLRRIALQQRREPRQKDEIIRKLRNRRTQDYTMLRQMLHDLKTRVDKQGSSVAELHSRVRKQDIAIKDLVRMVKNLKAEQKATNAKLRLPQTSKKKDQ